MADKKKRGQRGSHAGSSHVDRAVELTRSLPKLATSTGVDPSAFMGRLDRGYQGEFSSSSCCRLRCLAQQCGNRCRSRGAATSANRRNSRSGALALQSSGQRSVGGSHPTGYSLLGERIVSLLLQGPQVGRPRGRRPPVDIALPDGLRNCVPCGFLVLPISQFGVDDDGKQILVFCAPKRMIQVL